ncbi:hypothetical protein D3C85_641590 [compost metagenome]
MHRVGVLELIDQCHRKLLANQGCQSLAAIGLQGRIEAQQHVVETHFRAAAFLLLESCPDPAGRMLQYGGIRRWQPIETGLEPGHRIEPRMSRRFALPGFGHAIRGQARETGADIQLLEGFVFGPGFDLFKPGLEIACLHLATVDSLAGNALVTDRKQLVRPLQPGLLEFDQGRPSLLQALRNHFGGFFPFKGIPLAGEQCTNPRQQRRRSAPIAAHPIQGVTLHRVAEQPPVIAQDFPQQVAVVGFQGLGKQAAAVECVLAQHALAPTVDGRHRRLVHPLGGDIQAVCASGPLLGQVLITQLGNQAVGGRCFIAEISCGLGEPRANAFAQLFGRGVGEGHDEDLRRQQLTPETTVLPAVAKHQTQVQRGNGERLAGPGTGFDQLAATERECQGQRCLRAHQRDSSLDRERQGASRSGR